MSLSDLMNKQDQITERISRSTSRDAIESVDTSSIIQLVSFTIDDVEYGIGILSVHDIQRVPNITRLPNVPHFVKGVMNYRGNVIPIIDARKRFGFPKAKLTELSRVIVIETNEKLVGLLVDNVHQVVRISEKNVDPPSSLIEGISEEFITGIGRLNDRLIIIMNITNFLFLEEEDSRLVIHKLQ